MSTKLTSVELNLSTADAPATSDNSAAVVTSAWVNSLLATFSTGSGSVTLPGGFVVKWGYYSGMPNNSPQSISFPVAFPTTCLAVVVSGAGSRVTSGNPQPTAANVVSASAFEAIAGGSSCDLSWIAVGH